MRRELAVALLFLAGAGCGADGSACVHTTAAASGGTVRFAAMGDIGSGGPTGQAVADALTAKCSVDGCDFVLLLGDNFHPNGVTRADDPQWIERFERPYAGIAAPFFAVLGNHDYGGLGSGYELEKGRAQIEYGERNARWIMPAPCYDFATEPAVFVALDTNLVIWDYDHAFNRQAELLDSALGKPAAWHIVFGHHPLFASEGLGSPLARAANFDSLGRSHLCGRADLYLCGHDHNRQLKLFADCPTLVAVSGAGSTTLPVQSDPAALFQRDTLGFAYVVASQEHLQLQMINAAGEVEYEIALGKAR